MVVDVGSSSNNIPNQEQEDNEDDDEEASDEQQGDDNDEEVDDAHEDAASVMYTADKVTARIVELDTWRWTEFTSSTVCGKILYQVYGRLRLVQFP